MFVVDNLRNYRSHVKIISLIERYIIPECYRLIDLEPQTCKAEGRAALVTKFRASASFRATRKWLDQFVIFVLFASTLGGSTTAEHVRGLSGDLKTGTKVRVRVKAPLATRPTRSYLLLEACTQQYTDLKIQAVQKIDYKNCVSISVPRINKKIHNKNNPHFVQNNQLRRRNHQ